MNRDFSDLVDTGGLSPDERQRLERVHNLLVASGPPPDLPAALAHPPAPAQGGTVATLPLWRNRGAAAASIAAALAVAAFAGGYLLGDRGDATSAVDAIRVVELQGVRHDAVASIRVGTEEPGGNWPMELTVTGLPPQTGDRDYYELFVLRDGKPGYPCVGFKMEQGTTTVRFVVPYELKESTELVVTEIEPGEIRWPGRVVMRT